MPATASSQDRDPLDRLAEEFVARLRASQRRVPTESAQKHPGLADPSRVGRFRILGRERDGCRVQGCDRSEVPGAVPA